MISRTSPIRTRVAYWDVIGSPWWRIPLIAACTAWGYVGVAIQQALASTTTPLQSIWIFVAALMPLVAVGIEMSVKISNFEARSKNASA